MTYHVQNTFQFKSCTWGKTSQNQLLLRLWVFQYIWNKIISKNNILTLWHPTAFRDFHEKYTETHVALRGTLFGLVSTTNLVKSSKGVESLVACARKKFFGWGVWIFCEWCHKWRTFRPPWPTLPGPGLKPLDGSISSKFLLETRLQSESFDILDDLLGFRVQKLWSKVTKIFD